jgi:hypothetical protein
LGARSLTMLPLLSVEDAEGVEYAEPAGVVAALRRICCCEGEVVFDAIVMKPGLIFRYSVTCLWHKSNKTNHPCAAAA